MKAYELAKQLYPALNKNDFIQQTCPDMLQICDKIDCDKHKFVVDEDCIKCWEQEVSQARANWLIESKRMCDLMGCGD